MENYKDCCIVTCAFREPYLTHNIRQLKSIDSFMPGLEVLSWRDCLPYSEGVVKENVVARFQQSLYGFKPHAIYEAYKKGYKRVVWLDPSVLPTSSPAILFDTLETIPIIVRTGDHDITSMTSQRVLDWFGINPGLLKGTKHVGGTVYGFNFKYGKASSVFNKWSLAEVSGMFGDQDEFMAGHWADESCMALSMFSHNAPQYYPTGFTYLNQKEL